MVIKDQNVRTAVIQMIAGHKKHFSSEPEYKNIINALGSLNSWLSGL